MASDKSERLLNLYIMLLAQTRFVPKQDIRRAHYGEYADNARGDEAFEKAFERDKEDLRELGVVIEVGSLDVFFDDEQGYRISTDTSSLPEIRFEADEAAVLGIAARAWEQAHAGAAHHRGDAQARRPGRRGRHRPASTWCRRACGPRSRPSTRAGRPPRSVASSPSTTAAPASSRAGAACSRGAWSAPPDAGTSWATTSTGDAERVFRLSRVQGKVGATGKAGAYDVPPGTDVKAIAANARAPHARHRGDRAGAPAGRGGPAPSRQPRRGGRRRARTERAAGTGWPSPARLRPRQRRC